jgi:cell division protein FtsA
LAKPTYSTCIGLILKGYDDYEHNRKQFETEFKKVEVPDSLKQTAVAEEVVVEESISADKMTKRKNLTGFWDKFKDRLVDLFKEEEDHRL